MKFIHCADLHLDSRMESNLSLDQEKQRREELLATFSRMVDYAQENDVRAILIAGDLFDKQHIRKEVRERVQLKIEENPGIDFLYLRGNHDFVDFLDEMEQIPANLKLFKEEEWTAYEYEEGVTVTGREISNRNYRLLTESLVLDEEKCNIVILHGKEAGSGGGDHTRVVDIPSYKEKYIDYLALGHLQLTKGELTATLAALKDGILTSAGRRGSCFCRFQTKKLNRLLFLLRSVCSMMFRWSFR